MDATWLTRPRIPVSAKSTYGRIHGWVEKPPCRWAADEVLWGRNGELFYRNRDRMMAVTVATQPTLNVGSPREVFAGSYSGNGAGRPIYDVTRDGRRFLMLQERSNVSQDAAPPRLIVVQNWLEELKRLVPTN